MKLKKIYRILLGILVTITTFSSQIKAKPLSQKVVEPVIISSFFLTSIICPLLLNEVIMDMCIRIKNNRSIPPERIIQMKIIGGIWATSAISFIILLIKKNSKE